MADLDSNLDIVFSFFNTTECTATDYIPLNKPLWVCNESVTRCSEITTERTLTQTTWPRQTPVCSSLRGTDEPCEADSGTHQACRLLNSLSLSLSLSLICRASADDDQTRQTAVKLPCPIDDPNSGLQYTLQLISSRLGRSSKHDVAVVNMRCDQGLEGVFDPLKRTSDAPPELTQPVETRTI